MTTSKQNLKEVADDRLTLRLSSTTKLLFSSLQKYHNYSSNGLLLHFLDLYTKYHEGSSDKLLSYCTATIADELIVSDITQMISDFNLSEVMRPSELYNEINTLKYQVAELRSEINKIIATQGAVDTKLQSTSIVIKHQNDSEVLISPTVTILPSNVTANSSLNKIVQGVLLNVLPSSLKLNSTNLTYDYYIHNYIEVKNAIADPKVLVDLSSKIDLFNQELLALLQSHCDNFDMCQCFLPTNPNVLLKYLNARLTLENLDCNILDVWELSLSELHNIILKLEKYEATSEFKITVTTLREPQAVLKSVLSKTYGFIFKTDKPLKFTTF